MRKLLRTMMAGLVFATAANANGDRATLGARQPQMQYGASRPNSDLGPMADGLLAELRKANLARDILNAHQGGALSRVLGDVGLRRKSSSSLATSPLNAGAGAPAGGICQIKQTGFEFNRASNDRGLLKMAVACLGLGGYTVLADRTVIEMRDSGETAVLFSDPNFRRRYRPMSGGTELDAAGLPVSTVGAHTVYAQLIQRNASLSKSAPSPATIRVSVDY